MFDQAKSQFQNESRHRQQGALQVQYVWKVCTKAYDHNVHECKNENEKENSSKRKRDDNASQVTIRKT